MNYEEALLYIHSVSWKGSVPGLERIGELCALLGNPQDKLKFVHIAGTNGKGSVSAVLSEILQGAGYKTGLFTSPYLIDFRERIVYNGEMISKGELCEVCEYVKSKAGLMKEAPTEFELITAMAFEYFARKKCDIVVLECGMGGRLDSTNIIKTPLVSVITNIALDHIAVLGDTEEKIAFEKSGIIKDAPVVVGRTGDGAFNVINEKCMEKGVKLYSFSDVEASSFVPKLGKLLFDYKGEKLMLPLCGLYQRDNIRCALAASEILASKGFKIGIETIKESLARVKWRARFETLCESPLIIFDGAHNENGMTSALETFRTLMPGVKPVAVTGVMADKAHGKIVSLLAHTACKVYTVTPDNPRALDAGKYADEFIKAGVDSESCDSVLSAVEKAVSYAKEKSIPVFCSGSLYMYAEVCEAVKKAVENK